MSAGHDEQTFEDPVTQARMHEIMDDPLFQRVFACLRYL